MRCGPSGEVAAEVLLGDLQLPSPPVLATAPADLPQPFAYGEAVAAKGSEALVVSVFLLRHDVSY